MRVTADGEVYFIAESRLADQGAVRRIDPDGTITTRAGTKWLADAADNQVVRFAPAGGSKVVAGRGAGGDAGDDGPAIQAKLNRPRSVAIGGDGSIYVSTRAAVRRVAPDGTITTVVGTGRPASSELIFGTDALWPPVPSWTTHEMVLDNAETLYIADVGNSRVRAVGEPAETFTGCPPGTQLFGRSHFPVAFRRRYPTPRC